MGKKGFAYAAPAAPTDAKHSSAGYGLAIASARSGRDTLGSEELRARIAAMPADEQRAYVTALAGPQDAANTGPGETVSASGPGNGTGCLQEAALSRQEMEAKVLPHLDRIGQELDKQPQHRAAEAKWAGCMKKQGQSFPNPESARAHIRQELAQLQKETAQQLAGKTADEALGLRPAIEKKVRVLANEELSLAAMDEGCAVQSGLKDVRSKLVGASRRDSDNQS